MVSRGRESLETHYSAKQPGLLISEIPEIQHITYNEWLPIILGMTYIDAFQMKPADSGFSKQYDDNVNPSITNVFATAAFRFGHSLVDSSLK